MKFKRVMIAAPKSGSGKTTITCALLQTLKSRGQQVVSYKCGPDYIDPMFHKQVIGIPSKNLDTFFTGEEKTRELFLKNRTEEDFAVLEGVMGLFDGLGGIREEGSSYHLAKVTKTPIVLVVDAKGMGRSVAALIAGFLAYDKEQLIKGVILNRMSKGYYEIVKPLIEEELKISVLGYFPECKEMHIESRHLGLVMPEELTDIKEHLRNTAEEFVKTVSVDGIMQIVENAEEITFKNRVADNQRPGNWATACYSEENCSMVDSDRESSAIERNVAERSATEDAIAGYETEEQKKKNPPVIAVARDEAFCFYYEDNSLLLQEKGAKITYFSPLHDRALPEDCNALLLGGGYPELYAEQLSANKSMLSSVKQAFDNGMPIVAECGGFMYLHSEMEDKEGTSYSMAGVVPGTCSYKGKLVRFGYIEVQEKQSRFLPEGQRIRAHEFHYFDSTDNGNNCLAIKPVTGREYPCIIEGENYWLGFPHLYYPSNPAFAEKFVEKAGSYRERVKV